MLKAVLGIQATRISGARFAMKYHLSVGDGQAYGPFDVSQLKAMAAEGRVNAASMLCAEGGSEWVPASSVLGTTAPPIAPTLAPQASTPRVSLVGPILATLFCCLPTGIVSIILATNANGKLDAGNMEGAAKDAKNSKTWLIVSVVLGVVFSIGYAILFIIAAAAENSY